MVSLSAVSGASRDATLRIGLLPGGALRIQRLEGSRPHGSLCTLHRSERVQKDQEQAELSRVQCPGDRIGRRCGSRRADVESGEAGLGGILPR
jgi:hypothetical protein